MGVDIGITGGISVLGNDDHLLPVMFAMPRTEDDVDVKRLINIIHQERHAVVAWVEKPFAMAKSGAHASMKFGKYYGLVIGALTAFGVPVKEIRPQEWQLEMYRGCPKKYEGKERSQWAFKKAFPRHGPMKHMGMIEAALIAEFGRRVENY